MYCKPRSTEVYRPWRRKCVFAGCSLEQRITLRETSACLSSVPPTTKKKPGKHSERLERFLPATTTTAEVRKGRYIVYENLISVQ